MFSRGGGGYRPNTLASFFGNDFLNDDTDYFKSCFVRIDAFSDSSIDMSVQCFTKNSEWDKFISVKEKLAINIKEIVENEKAGFAFPSQSIYVEKK